MAPGSTLVEDADMAGVVEAYANCDHSYVVWRYDEPIRDSGGFAQYRKYEKTRSGSATPVVGLEVPPDELSRSTLM